MGGIANPDLHRHAKAMGWIGYLTNSLAKYHEDKANCFASAEKFTCRKK